MTEPVGLNAFGRFLSFLLRPQVAAVILFFIVLAVSFQNYQLSGGAARTEVNSQYTNYIIFRQSFLHLIQNKDLYLAYPKEYLDLYKYSPAFALLMAPFALLPDFAGLVLWNALNAFLLFYAFFKFPFRSDKQKLFALVFVLIEAVISMQNSQSNCLMAGLILLTYLFMEKEKVMLAALCIVITVFIKLFGALAFLLFLFYPNKFKAIAWTFLWTLLFLVLPLLVISYPQLISLYKSWGQLLSADHAISYGLSVMALINSWFGVENMKNILLLIGALLLCLPLLKFNSYRSEKFRQLFLSSLLIWMVIFNYKSESPSYVIAIAGVAIWYFIQDYKGINLILLLFTVLLTELSSSDIIPLFIRNEFIKPHFLKALPCIFLWIKIQYELLTIDISRNGRKPAASI